MMHVDTDPDTKFQQPNARFYKQEQQPNASTSSSQTRAVPAAKREIPQARAAAKREHKHQPNASSSSSQTRAVPAASSITSSFGNQTRSRSTHEQKFQQLLVARAVPATSGSPNSFRQGKP
ncbi:hypothetical protein WN943_003299 [Citrus x changshan-huyou]